MKRMMFLMLLAFTFTVVSAKKYPVIKFEKTVIDFGTFSQDEPVQKAIFKFTNVGDSKLVINYVHTSCGCTVAEYTKDFISPGGTGQIVVTYNGSGKMPGEFKRYVLFGRCSSGNRITMWTASMC